MKILLIQLGWSGQGISGGDKHALESAKLWQKEAVVHLLLPLSGLDFLERNLPELAAGFTTHPLWQVFGFEKLTNLPAILWIYGQRLLLSCFQILSLGKFDVVISSSHFLYDLAPAVAAGVFHKSKVAVYVYHLISRQGRGHGLRNGLSFVFEALSLNLIKLFADVVFVDNRATFEVLTAVGLKPDVLHFTKIGVKTVSSALENKIYDLCFVGRLVRAKGVYDLLDAVERLKKSYADLVMALAGGGDEADSLRTEISRRSLGDNVRMLGFVSEEEKFKIIARSKVFVSPSYEEGWGMSVAEAMASGRPAVVYELPAIREAFGEAPVYVKVGDVLALAAALNRLLTDGDFYEKKSFEARKALENYNLNEIAFGELSVLKTALNL